MSDSYILETEVPAVFYGSPQSDQGDQDYEAFDNSHK